jgi:uncharacterized protein involved in exopolysaccharide biosynthesis
LAEREQQYEDEGQAAGRPGLPLDPQRLLLLVKRRWQIVVVMTVLGAFLGAAIAKKFIAQTFTAHAVLVWEGGAQVTQVQRQTTIESVTLTSNLERVKAAMKLAAPVDVLRNALQVSSSQQSNLIRIDGVWADPDGAAKVVNELVDAFLNAQLTLAKERVNADVERMRAAAKGAEAKLSAASSAYEKFRAESGIADVSQERQIAIQRAAELAAQSDLAKAQAAAARAELDRLRANGATSAAPPSDVGADSLRHVDQQQRKQEEERLAQARRGLSAARVQYSADHPNVLRLEAEIESLEKSLASASAVSSSSPRRLESAQRAEAQAASRQKAAEEYAAQVQERLGKLSAAEGKAAVLLGEIRVQQEALNAAKGMLTATELQAQKTVSDFRVLERAVPPEFALESKRKKVAFAVPAAFFVFSLLGVLGWGLRRLDVCTPAEAAFWSGLPVVGATTWPRDPDMLPSLMHDLDDYAPRCKGVTLIVGVSLDEAHLARRVSEWDNGSRGGPVGPVNEQLLLTAGADAVRGGHRMVLREGDTPGQEPELPNMQILTLTGPVPAQALRRAARMADRVLVVVTSGKHNVFQLMKIRSRLGRDAGIGLLLVGLQKDLAMVRDRVGEVERFWFAARGRTEAS